MLKILTVQSDHDKVCTVSKDVGIIRLTLAWNEWKTTMLVHFHILSVFYVRFSKNLVEQYQFSHTLSLSSFDLFSFLERVCVCVCVREQRMIYIFSIEIKRRRRFSNDFVVLLRYIHSHVCRMKLIFASSSANETLSFSIRRN